MMEEQTESGCAVREESVETHESAMEKLMRDHEKIICMKVIRD